MSRRKQRSELIKQINNRKTDWSDKEDDAKRAVALGVVDLHSSVAPMLILSLLYGATVVTQIFAAPMLDIPTASWYRNLISYTAVLPAAIGVLVFGYIIYSYLHNMQRRAQSIFYAVVGFWTAVLFVLWVWIWVEMFWYCPTNTPTYCTDGITSSLDTGYLLYAIATLIQMPILLAIIIYYARKMRLWGAIYSASGYDGKSLGPLIYKSEAYVHKMHISIGQGLDPHEAVFGNPQRISQPIPSNQSFRTVLTRLLAEAKAEHKEVAQGQDSTAMVTGIHDMHGFVMPILVVSLLYGLTLIVQIFAAPLIPMPQGDWHTTFVSYRIILPPALGTLIFGYIIFAYGHNIRRWSYAIHGILVGLWTLILSILWVWLWIEYFWFCPTNTPTYCTNGMTPDLALGYEMYAIVTLIQVPILWVELIIFGIAAGYWRKLYTLTTWGPTLLDEMLYNEPEFRNYLVTIGKKNT